jgi:hypothetical protein
LIPVRGPGTPVPKWHREKVKTSAINMYIRGCGPVEIARLTAISRMTLYRFLDEVGIPRGRRRRASPAWERPLELIRLLYLKATTGADSDELSDMMRRRFGVDLSPTAVGKMIAFVGRNLADLVPICGIYRELCDTFQSDIAPQPRMLDRAATIVGAACGRSPEGCAGNEPRCDPSFRK